ncbi:supervillin isoform X3 [Betta splendens]|uniref:Supervillin isoform X3 n=1 Tax=Betta splendens TaxID=158456 RepID=A0A6P7NAX3_BETSP|nr:supervillin isoform X3 [Betta splendens]
MVMDSTDDPVPEPRSERIARYKAERRRELAERYGNVEELPSKWVKRDGREAHEPAIQAHGGPLSSEPGLNQGVNGRTRGVTNGLEADAHAESDYLRRQGSQDSASAHSGQLHTRVSVGRLRSSLLQRSGAGAAPDKASPDAGRTASSLDLAVRPGPEGRRRTQRYLPAGPAGARKSGERFRTQPITAHEVEESSGLLDPAEEHSEADVKTDERAKMSVAAKMSLFKELERSAAPPKARSGACRDRRGRRGNEHRFLTQPITCEEMVTISASTPGAPLEPPSVHAESAEDGDQNCKLSMSEKLALFNKLSLPGRRDDGRADGPPERRRQKGARYRTQPITVEEVGLLQKGPVQLPALCLSSHLSDRQQASSVNLKPSEVRFSQSRPDGGTGPEESSPGQHRDPETGLRGILKKSRSERSGTEAPLHREQNGGGCGAAAAEAALEVHAPPRRRRTSSAEGGSSTAAPWRQRARNGTETGASATRTEPERDAALDQPASSLELSSRIQQEDEKESETTATGGVRVSLADGSTEPQDPTIGTNSAEETETLAAPQRWTNLSFEAQEVSSPTKNQPQPQWRQKAGGAEDQEPHADKDEDFEAEAAAQCAPPSPPREATEPVAADGGSSGDRSPPSSRPRPPAGDGAAESEQDLDVLCQTNMPMLTSAVAEHRRSVRPSRRTQGSRNPLRALAAREDIRQDYMGERVGTTEERIQAEKKSKNSSPEASPPRSTDSSFDAARAARPPFSSLMLIHVKGRQHVQARVVEPSARSLNSGDCFLLVSPEHCVVWSGEFASEQERAKASALASFIQRHGDLGCRASRVVRLEEGLNSDGSVAADFWSLLGGRTPYRGAGAPEEDEVYERGVVESNCVYRLVETRLVPYERAWASVPTTSLLSPTEALVFDFGSELYLWLGLDVPPGRRSVALQLTQQVWAGAYDYSNCGVNPLDPTQRNPGVQPRGEGRPAWALFGVLSQHSETSLFTEKFLDWPRGGGGSEDAAAVDDEAQVGSDRFNPFHSGESVTRLLSSQPEPPAPDLLASCDSASLAPGQTAEEVGSVLDGLGVRRGGSGVVALEDGGRAELRTLAVDTWHVQEFGDSEVPVQSAGQLHQGDSYVIRWTHSAGAADDVDGPDGSGPDGSGPKQSTTFFLWRGRHSSVSGRDTAAFLSIGTKTPPESQVAVSQGSEPPCFLQLFHGGLVVHKGKREEASAHEGWRLFCVRGELPEEGSLLEVDCCCAGLRSRGCVVLLNSQQGVLYLWTGCKAHSSVREVGRRTVERLTQMRPPELGLGADQPVEVEAVEEGSEPAGFWAALGPMDRKAYDCMLHDPGKYNFTPRLFHLSARSGSLRARELQSPHRLPGLVMAMPFVQESLYSEPQPALFLLDNRLEVYLWQRGQPEQTESSASAWTRWHNERRCAMQTALQYCKEMNPRRPPQAYLVLEGSEPLTFTNVFPHWDTSLGPRSQGCTGRVKLTMVQDALAQLMKTQYPLEELLQNPLPEGVDPQHLEVYLSDQDFQTILEMKRDEYASLPSWKQIDLKKSKGLLY